MSTAPELDLQQLQVFVLPSESSLNDNLQDGNVLMQFVMAPSVSTPILSTIAECQIFNVNGISSKINVATFRRCFEGYIKNRCQYTDKIALPRDQSKGSATIHSVIPLFESKKYILVVTWTLLAKIRDFPLAVIIYDTNKAVERMFFKHKLGSLNIFFFS